MCDEGERDLASISKGQDKKAPADIAPQYGFPGQQQKIPVLGLPEGFHLVRDDRFKSSQERAGSQSHSSEQ